MIIVYLNYYSNVRSNKMRKALGLVEVDSFFAHGNLISLRYAISNLHIGVNSSYYRDYLFYALVHGTYLAESG